MKVIVTRIENEIQETFNKNVYDLENFVQDSKKETLENENLQIVFSYKTFSKGSIDLNKFKISKGKKTKLKS